MDKVNSIAGQIANSILRVVTFVGCGAVILVLWLYSISIVYRQLPALGERYGDWFVSLLMTLMIVGPVLAGFRHLRHRREKRKATQTESRQGDTSVTEEVTDGQG